MRSMHGQSAARLYQQLRVNMRKHQQLMGRVPLGSRPPGPAKRTTAANLVPLLSLQLPFQPTMQPSVTLAEPAFALCGTTWQFTISAQNAAGLWSAPSDPTSPYTAPPCPSPPPPPVKASPPPLKASPPPSPKAASPPPPKRSPPPPPKRSPPPPSKRPPPPKAAASPPPPKGKGSPPPRPPPPSPSPPPPA